MIKMKFLTNFFSTFFSKEEKPSRWKRCIRVGIDATQGFIEDDCYSKASALTFYSLLSIVPVLAVLFGIAKGFGFERALEFEIKEKFFEQQELTDKLIQFAYSWLNNAQGGVIAGVGTAVLLWSVLGLINNIETALNAIWKTRVSRSYSRRVSDYLAALIIGPIFLVAVSSINVFITTQITQSAQSNIFVEVVSPFILFVLKFFPYFLSWVLFTFIYIFMPNTKVYFRSAVVAGILAGTSFQLWQWIYIKFQIGVASYGAIYGSFAALPLFLVWLQTSWLILLAGAEVAVQLENDLFIPMRTLHPISNKAAALLITYRCIEAFDQNKSPIQDYVFAKELGMSLHHIQVLLEALEKAKILVSVYDSSKDQYYGYQPGRAIHSINMKTVCDAIDTYNQIPASVKESKEMNKIQDYLQQVNQMLSKSQYNPPLYTHTQLPLE
jgi:membrane protein